MKKIAMSALVLMLTIICLSVEAGVFGWIKKKGLQLSPEVNGMILLKGQIVAGLKITRDLTYGDEVFSDYVLTDKHGSFSFPAKTIKVRDSMFDTNVRQEIYAEHEGKLLKLWRARALNSVDFKSYNVLLNSMICELTAPEMLFDLESDPAQPGLYLGATGICSFTNEGPIMNKEPV